MHAYGLVWRGVSAIALFCALSTASGARAQDDAGARAHFQAGAHDFSAGRYESALTSFESAYALSGRSQLLYNIALCHQELGRTAEAATYLRRFLEEVEDVPERSVLEARLARLEARAREEAAAAQAGEPDPDDAPSSPPARRRRVPTSAWVLWSASGATLVTGVTLGAVGLARKNDFESGCGRSASCDRDEVRRMERLGIFADVSFGLTLVGATTGVVLWLRHRASEGEASETRALVLPILSRDVVGATLTRSF